MSAEAGLAGTSGVGALLGLGFWLGLQHATEPDHLAAVSAMATSGLDAGTAAHIFGRYSA